MQPVTAVAVTAATSTRPRFVANLAFDMARPLARRSREIDLYSSEYGETDPEIEYATATR
jgi:hypothetical protein